MSENGRQTTKTKRTTVTRAPQRASYDIQLLQEIIKESIIGHLSFNHDNSVHSIPMPFWCIGAYLYCHCSVGRRLSKLVDSHQDSCISFAIIDALVLAKSAFRHSFNYRSVVIYGQFELVIDNQEKMKAMKKFMELFDKERWGEARIPNKKELNATAILKLPLKEAVTKMRKGPPNDKKADLDREVWTGIIPKLYSYGKPEPS